MLWNTASKGQKGFGGVAWLAWAVNMEKNFSEGKKKTLYVLRAETIFI